jgi:hypothetical protein
VRLERKPAIPCALAAINLQSDYPIKPQEWQFISPLRRGATMCEELARKARNNKKDKMLSPFSLELV